MKVDNGMPVSVVPTPAKRVHAYVVAIASLRCLIVDKVLSRGPVMARPISEWQDGFLVAILHMEV